MLRPGEHSGKLGALVGWLLGIIAHRDKDTKLLKRDILVCILHYINIKERRGRGRKI